MAKRFPRPRLAQAMKGAVVRNDGMSPGVSRRGCWIAPGRRPRISIRFSVGPNRPAALGGRREEHEKKPSVPPPRCPPQCGHYWGVGHSRPALRTGAHKTIQRALALVGCGKVGFGEETGAGVADSGRDWGAGIPEAVGRHDGDVVELRVAGSHGPPRRGAVVCDGRRRGVGARRPERRGAAWLAGGAGAAEPPERPCGKGPVPDAERPARAVVIRALAGCITATVARELCASPPTRASGPKAAVYALWTYIIRAWRHSLAFAGNCYGAKHGTEDTIINGCGF